MARNGNNVPDTAKTYPETLGTNSQGPTLSLIAHSG